MAEDFEFSHVNRAGRNIIIFFVANKVNAWPAVQKDNLRSQLEACGHSAKLLGTAVLTWQVGNQWRTWAPSDVQSALNGLSIEEIVLGGGLGKLRCG
jgi:hypothetical protein